MAAIWRIGRSLPPAEMAKLSEQAKPVVDKYSENKVLVGDLNAVLAKVRSGK